MDNFMKSMDYIIILPKYGYYNFTKVIESAGRPLFLHVHFGFAYLIYPCISYYVASCLGQNRPQNTF